MADSPRFSAEAAADPRRFRLIEECDLPDDALVASVARRIVFSRPPFRRLRILGAVGDRRRLSAMINADLKTGRRIASALNLAVRGRDLVSILREAGPAPEDAPYVGVSGDNEDALRRFVDAHCAACGAPQPGNHAQALTLARIHPRDLLTNGEAMRVTLRHGQPLVDAYAQLMREGAKFPPVIAQATEDGPDLMEGFHRVAAARQADLPAIDVVVLHGLPEREDLGW